MINREQKQRAYEALRAAGFEPALARELLAGPKGLRDELAGQAMGALLTRQVVTHESDREHAAWTAYQMADVMMRRRQEFPV
jgi:hypothetical protein